ncbi:hypothetical protein RRG08_008966 [Elysia crispata]|uniref:Uncharacterized protein n=1 Tax=Elysia crispata TaxID=231223 RepID=A0AAE1AJJ6_9GAST|nr:hypothetical protein RRG08_008966 [Elysia crispata]
MCYLLHCPLATSGADVYVFDYCSVFTCPGFLPCVISSTVLLPPVERTSTSLIIVMSSLVQVSCHVLSPPLSSCHQWSGRLRL